MVSTHAAGHCMANPSGADSFAVLGVRVHAVQMDGIISQMENWIARRENGHIIAVTGMHGVTEAQHDPSFKRILNEASLVIPDGYPLVVLGRRKGFDLPRRTCGSELMGSFFERTKHRGYRHFFYGGAPGVAEGLAGRFHRELDALVVGTYCPPFRALSRDEESEVSGRITKARPDVLWVGLSTPKQEKWMAQFRSRLDVPVLAGVGAAFDFHTGRVRRAPQWMGNNGLEWLFRLALEPRRLWKRYILYGSEFVFRVTLEELGLSPHRQVR